MAADYQDKIILFGDSLTQKSWDPDLGGIGARLTGTPILDIDSLDRWTSDRAMPQIRMRASSTF
jgi:hypothetical protein